jgi:hypothetical protein
MCTTPSSYGLCRWSMSTIDRNKETCGTPHYLILITCERSSPLERDRGLGGLVINDTVKNFGAVVRRLTSEPLPNDRDVAQNRARHGVSRTHAGCRNHDVPAQPRGKWCIMWAACLVCWRFACFLWIRVVWRCEMRGAVCAPQRGKTCYYSETKGNLLLCRSTLYTILYKASRWDLHSSVQVL